MADQPPFEDTGRCVLHGHLDCPPCEAAEAAIEPPPSDIGWWTVMEWIGEHPDDVDARAVLVSIGRVARRLSYQPVTVLDRLALAVIEAARGVVAEWTIRGDNGCDKARQQRLIDALTALEDQRSDA